MTSLLHPGYFDAGVASIDPEVHAALVAEEDRQSDGIELIASENIVSRATLDALGTAVINKTVEGYPGRRYYGGAAHADTLERLAIERARTLFDCTYANVQPQSGSQANLAVFLAFLTPGDTVLSMDLSAGGHLSHGSRANLTGKWFDIVHYGVRDDDGLIDYDDVARLAERHRPKLIVCGGSAYPRAIDFGRFRAIADTVGAILLADMAHFAGLTCNKNTVPGDTQSPAVTSGLRFGVSAGTTRGFRAAEFESIGHLVADLLDALTHRGADQPNLEARIRGAVAEITHRFPIYGRA